LIAAALSRSEKQSNPTTPHCHHRKEERKRQQTTTSVKDHEIAFPYISELE
jgi:hypothetical protein